MSVDELIQQAVGLARSGDKAGARKILAGVVKAEPGNARAWYLLSQVVEEREQAEYCLKMVMQLKPGDSQAQHRLALLQDREKPAGSIQTKRVVEIKPENSWRPSAATILIVLIIVACVGGSWIVSANNARWAALGSNQMTAIPTRRSSEFIGLGEKMSNWNANHQADKSNEGSYDHGKFWITDYDGRINHLEIIWGNNSTIAIEKARQEAGAFLPSDRQLLDTYEPREYRIVEHLSSKSLAHAFDDKFVWLGSPAGEFIIIYRIYYGKVSSVVLSLGNNP